MTTKNTHGGAGRGQGRKSQYAEKLKSVTIRLTEAQKETYKRLGGNQAVRDWLDLVETVESSLTIDQPEWKRDNVGFYIEVD